MRLLSVACLALLPVVHATECYDGETEYVHGTVATLEDGRTCTCLNAVWQQCSSADSADTPIPTPAPASDGFSVDLDNDNAFTGAVLSALGGAVGADISPSGGDASMVLRVSTLLYNAGFDAVAPYHETAVGVYSRIDRRPAAEATNRNVNIAFLHASHVILVDILPQHKAVFDQVLTDNDLDPESESLTDLTSPIGIGYKAATEVVAARENDGMNSRGNVGKEYHFQPFTDTTGYGPVNTAYVLNNASRWQPDLQRLSTGLYKIQQFVTPQWAVTEPYSYADPTVWQMPEPVMSNVENWDQYKAQADAVLEASAELTEAQKLDGEFFDNKGRSLGGSIIAAGAALSTMEFIQLEFLANLAAHDAGVFVWNEKRRWDAVRPFSAIRHIYGEDRVEAYGGPGKGTVSLTGNDWAAYQEEADHPEYPSASTCFCHSHAQASRLYFDSDSLNFTSVFAAGSTRNEPGLTPAVDTSVSYSSWTDFAERCGQSRVWTGVHFQPAVDEAANICGQFGDFAYDFWQSYMNGTAAVRAPASPLPVPSFF